MHAWSNSSHFPLPWIGAIGSRQGYIEMELNGQPRSLPRSLNALVDCGSGRLEYTRALWIGL
ncbi:hypothetical protein EAF00_008686 [Botryotinia globosa]|nr:hypothetical protein EAF00_008686 [Botryotinia globosa]